MQAIQTAGIDEQSVVFHVNNATISYLPEVMNPLEAILEGSEISHLFGDDSETLASYLKHAAKHDSNKSSSIENFWQSTLTFPPAGTK